MCCQHSIPNQCILGDLDSILGSILKDVAKHEVLDYLTAKEVEGIDDIKRLQEEELDSLLLGILPEPRRARVREVLHPLISMN